MSEAAKLYPTTEYIVFDDFKIRLGRDEDKIAAVLMCFSSDYNGDGYTIRSVRECATKYTSVGERIVNLIIRALSYDYKLIMFDTKKRRWVPRDSLPKFKSYDDAIEYVVKNHLKFR